MSWLLKLATVKGKNADHVVVVGTHFRIIDLAPKPYRAYAQGPQGNAKIRLWNRLMKRYSGDYKFVDPYNITSSLTKAYEDTEDGMHMGFWINLQKVLLALNSTYALF